MNAKPTLRHYAAEVLGATMGGILVTSLEKYIRPYLPDPHSDWQYGASVITALAGGAAFFGLGASGVRLVKQCWGAKTRKIRELELELAALHVCVKASEAQRSADSQLAVNMSEVRHRAVHQMRDALTRLFPLRDRYEPPPVVPGSSPNARPPSHPGLLAIRADIKTQLQALVDEFKMKVGDKADVFACLRELGGDGKFHTFERAGVFDVNRDRNTAPWDKATHKVYKRLDSRCKDSHCVILSLAGTPEFPDNLADARRDSHGYRANECMLSGAVFAKSMVGYEIRNSRMVWIVSVCVNRPGVLEESDCELLRSHVDLFSALLNGMLHTFELRPTSSH